MILNDGMGPKLGSMFGHERKQKIMNWARLNGRINVKDMARHLEVTPETVRRDLNDLEHRGLVKRVHGGAILAEQATLEPEVFARSVTMTTEKRRIATRAVEELPTEGVVFIDAGTTTALIAELLPVDCRLMFVTNSLTFALGAVSVGNIEVMMVGGHIRGLTLATVGSWSTGILDGLSIDLAVIATNGISSRRGLTTPNPDEAATKRAAVGAARRSILVADHSKIGVDYFERFAEISDISLFITDRGAHPEDLAALAETGLAVETV